MKPSKNSLLSFGLAGIVFLSACVPSLHPLFTPETTAFREDLLGMWKEDPQEEGSWTFTKADENAYKVTIEEEGEPSVLEGRLVKLNDAYFLDLFPSGQALAEANLGDFYKATLIPGHLILKVVFGPKLELYLLQPDGLKEILAANSKALDHAYPQKDRLIITAPTDELQDFIKKQSDTASLWGEPALLQKLVL